MGAMSTLNFGHALWDYSHKMTLVYPHFPSVEEKDAAVAFFASHVYLLPCDACKYHWEGFLNENPVEANSRMELIDWTRRAHNFVNRKLHKPEWSLKDLFEYYSYALSDADTHTVLERVQEAKRETALLMRNTSAENLVLTTTDGVLREQLSQSAHDYSCAKRRLNARDTQLTILILVVVVLFFLYVASLVKLARRRKNGVN